VGKGRVSTGPRRPPTTRDQKERYLCIKDGFTVLMLTHFIFLVVLRPVSCFFFLFFFSLRCFVIFVFFFFFFLVFFFFLLFPEDPWDRVTPGREPRGDGSSLPDKKGAPGFFSVGRQRKLHVLLVHASACDPVTVDRRFPPGKQGEGLFPEVLELPPAG